MRGPEWCQGLKPESIATVVSGKRESVELKVRFLDMNNGVCENKL